jgi:hypothetical protein
MPRTPEGERAMTPAERQTKHRKRDKERQNMLVSLALVICQATAELDTSGAITPGTHNEMRKLSDQLGQYGGVLNPEV